MFLFDHLEGHGLSYLKEFPFDSIVYQIEAKNRGNLYAMIDENYFVKVYKVVRQIPAGKVATYGQIASLVNGSSLSSRKRITPRIVGFALHANTDRGNPCHRVVDRNGRLAPNFAFDGAKEQRLRLLAENVPFKDRNHVDLEKCQWE